MPPGDQGRRRPRRRRKLCFQLAKRHRTRLAHTASPAGWGQGWRPAGGRGEMGTEVWDDGRQSWHGVGVRWRSAVWGGGTGAGTETERVRRECAGGIGVTQQGGLSSGPRKLLASAGCLRFQDGEDTRGAGASSPGKLSSPGTALGGRELREPAPSGVAAGCLSWAEVWSPCFQPVSGKPASGIPGELGGPPWPRGSTWGLRWISKPGLGACPAMQRSSLQYSIWELWLVPFLQKPTQESKVIPAWVGALQSGQRNDPGIVGRGCSPSFGND